MIGLRSLLPRRLRLRLVLLAVCTLLFQQFAVAAHGCNRMLPAAPMAHAMVDCDDAPSPADAASPLCDQHCTGEHWVSPDLKAPQVPPLMLPAPLFALATMIQPAPDGRFYEDVPTCRSDPPPAERFCSLQI